MKGIAVAVIGLALTGTAAHAEQSATDKLLGCWKLFPQQRRVTRDLCFFDNAKGQAMISDVAAFGAGTGAEVSVIKFDWQMRDGRSIVFTGYACQITRGVVGDSEIELSGCGANVVMRRRCRQIDAQTKIPVNEDRPGCVRP